MPGPGAYEPKTATDPQGKYFLATIKNNGAPSFSLPSLKRFQEVKSDNVPGPGNYTLKIGVSDPAYKYVSTFKSPKTRTFYHSDRKTIEIASDTSSKKLVKEIRIPWTWKLPSSF